MRRPAPRRLHFSAGDGGPLSETHGVIRVTSWSEASQRQSSRINFPVRCSAGVFASSCACSIAAGDRCGRALLRQGCGRDFTNVTGIQASELHGNRSFRPAAGSADQAVFGFGSRSPETCPDSLCGSVCRYSAGSAYGHDTGICDPVRDRGRTAFHCGGNVDLQCPAGKSGLSQCQVTTGSSHKAATQRAA